VPAPRTCRACAANLPPDVRWCGQCHEPVREFQRRERLHRGDFVDVARDIVPTSRRGGGEGALSFRARIVVTIFALGLLGLLGVFALSSAVIVFMVPVVVLPAIAFAVPVFRDLWRPVPIATASATEPTRLSWAELRGSFARTGPREPLPRRKKIVWATMVAIYLGTVVTYVLGDDTVKGVVAVCVILTGFGLAMARLFRR
jgi:hypothetical protein